MSCSGACSPGFYCPSGSTLANAVPCPVGRYQDRLGGGDVSNCTICPAGRFSNATALNVTCPGQCSLGHYCPAGSTLATAVPCPLGRYRDTQGAGAEADCRGCAAGRFGNTTGMTSPLCTGECRAGYYCPANSTLPTAVPCPGGRYSAISGASSLLNCTSCPSGSYCPLASLAPRVCEIGTYCPATSSAAITCSNGTVANATGQAECYPCPPGWYDDVSAGHSGCVQCVAGRYSTNPESTSCSACPSGRFADVGGKTECSECPAGTFQNGTAGTMCSVCSALGSFSLGNATDCSMYVTQTGV